MPETYESAGRTPRLSLERRGTLRSDRERRFRSLYEVHLDRVARYVARRTSSGDVQDIVAETFLVAWRRLEQVPDDAIPWLYVTARNLIANKRRGTERQASVANKLAALPRWDPNVSPNNLDIDERLIEAIRQLPERQREAFMLVAWEGLDNARAARAAGCSLAAFRVRLHRARRQLARMLSPSRPLASEVRSILEERR